MKENTIKMLTDIKNFLKKKKIYIYGQNLRFNENIRTKIRHLKIFRLKLNKYEITKE